MAYIRYEYCPVCERDTQHINMNCRECKERHMRGSVTGKRAHIFIIDDPFKDWMEAIAAWNALTNEEKLQDLKKRVEKLEQKPIVY